MTARSRSTFYWAMRLMPRERRAAMFAIYDLARALDDVADGPDSREAKKAALAEWRAELGRLYDGAPTHDLTRALAPAVARFDLPRAEFEQLILGMEMDVDGPLVAPARAVLDLYCRRVASAVGLLALPVFGASGQAERELALYLGRALQLTNILRDIAGDAATGRLYVPDEYLVQAGVTSRVPAQAIREAGFEGAARRLARDAAAAFGAAERQMTRCNRKALWPAAAMLASYRDLLARVEARSFAATEPVAPSRLTALGAALGAAIASRF